jgi:hypothetical protein
MANTSPSDEPRDPLDRLAIKPFCDLPDVEHLTVEQRYALHEFFHAVLTAGYKLYQVVPARRAADIIRKKFGHMIAHV